MVILSMVIIHKHQAAWHCTRLYVVRMVCVCVCVCVRVQRVCV